jgi:hypothetical protein
MPIRPLLEGERAAFGPDDISAITAAFEQALRELRLIDRGDPAVALVAEGDGCCAASGPLAKCYPPAHGAG